MAEQQRDLMLVLALQALNIEQLERVDNLTKNIAAKDGTTVTENLRLEMPGGDRVLEILRTFGQLSDEAFNNFKTMLSQSQSEAKDFTNDVQGITVQMERLKKEITEVSHLKGLLSEESAKEMGRTSARPLAFVAEEKFGLSKAPGDTVEDKLGNIATAKQAELDALQAKVASLTGSQGELNVSQQEGVRITALLEEMEKNRSKGLTLQKKEIASLTAALKKLNSQIDSIATGGGFKDKIDTAVRSFTELKDQIALSNQQMVEMVEQVKRVKAAAKTPTAPKERKSITQKWLEARGEPGSESRFGQVVGAGKFATFRLAAYMVAARILFSIQNAIRNAGRYAVDFEKTLSEIQGVLPSKSQMEAIMIGESAIKAASEYGVALTEAAGAAKIFAQTGKNASEIAKAMEASLMAVRGANLSMDQAQQFIIAIENISEKELEAFEILDRISRVESRRAITATDLASGLQKIGPVVRQLRGDMRGLVDEFDVAIGALTTIVEKTRVSGTAASTSLKFMLSRMGSPEVLKQIQSLSGVGLARPGGTQLRPFVEILHELSAAYQQLMKDNKSGQAFQLLTVLGGSRQIQATAAVLENFAGTSLQTARMSALAFNDATERTAIALDTVDAKLKRVAVGWANLADAVLNNTLVNSVVKGSLDVLSGTFNATAAGLKFVDAAATEFFHNLDNLIGGDSVRGRLKFIDMSGIDIDKVPKLKQFVSTATEANMTVDELMGKVDSLVEALSGELVATTGMSIPELLKQLDEVATGDKFRDLHEVFGMKLASGLSNVLPKFAELMTTLEKTEDPAEKAKIQTQLLSEAYDMLAISAFTANAVMAANLDKLRNELPSRVDQLSTELRGVLEKNAQMLQVGFKVDPLYFMGLSKSPIKLAHTGFDEFNEIMDKQKSTGLQGMIGGFFGLGSQLQFLADSFSLATGALEDWNAAKEEAYFANVGSNSFAFALDRFSQRIAADTNKRKQVVGVLTARLTDLIMKEGIPGASALKGVGTGELFIKNFTDMLSEAASNIINSAEATAELKKGALDLQTALTSSGMRGKDFLTTMDRAASGLRSKLLDLLTTYAVVMDSNRQLAESYRDLNMFFDRQEADFSATKSLFESLTKVQNELRKDILLTENQWRSMGGAIDELFEKKGIKGLSAADMFSAMPETEGAEEALGPKNADTVNKYKEKLIQLRSELRLLTDDSLSDLMGGSQEAAVMMGFLDDALARTGLTAREAMATYYVLTKTMGISTGIQNEELLARKKASAVLEAQIKIIESAAGAREKLIELEAKSGQDVQKRRSDALVSVLSLSKNLTPVLQEQLAIERRLYGIEVNRIDRVYRNQREAADTTLQAVKDKAIYDFGSLEMDKAREALYPAEEEHNQRINNLTEERNAALREAVVNLNELSDAKKTDALKSAYTDFSKQVQQNVNSATSGIKALLTDINTFTSGKGIDAVLRPIGGTFMDRMADQFLQGLFDAESEGFFGELASKFGESTENQLANRLKEAAQVAGTDIATRFATAGEIVANRIAAAMGQHLPPAEELNFPGSSGKLRKQLSRNQQMLALAGSMGGGLLGSQIGKSGNAELGAQLGTAIGTMIAPGIGSALGGLAGGVLGGLLGGEEEQKAQTQSLKRIEQNTSRSADVLELEKRFLDVARGAVNIPSTFNVPNFTPGAGGGQTIVRQTNQIRVSVSVSGAKNTNETMEAIRSELGPLIVEELGRIGY